MQTTIQLRQRRSSQSPLCQFTHQRFFITVCNVHPLSPRRSDGVKKLVPVGMIGEDKPVWETATLHCSRNEAPAGNERHIRRTELPCPR